MIPKADDTVDLEAYTDADWSGDPISRKSTSGGVLTASIDEGQRRYTCKSFWN